MEVIFFLGAAQAFFLAVLVFNKKGNSHGAYIYENLYKPIPESHQEYIKRGYTSFQVPFVKAFHSAGGKLLIGNLETVETIVPGKDANLVLLNANPLEDISNTRGIEGVLCQGSWISRTEISARMGEIARSYNELKDMNRKNTSL